MYQLITLLFVRLVFSNECNNLFTAFDKLVYGVDLAHYDDNGFSEEWITTSKYPIIKITCNTFVNTINNYKIPNSI